MAEVEQAPAADAEEQAKLAADGGAAAAGAADDAPDTFEPSAVYEPVVSLPEVEVKTFEEEEEEVLKMRCKLYCFSEKMLDRGTGKKEWNNKGHGDVKILKHRETQRYRMLMRHEQTMKLIMNQVIDPRITMIPNAGNDRSWVWSAWDFSSGELEELCLAAKFSTPEVAQEFRAVFDRAQAEMAALTAGADAPADAAAEEAADAIERLDVKEGEGEAAAAAAAAVEAPAAAEGAADKAEGAVDAA